MQTNRELNSYTLWITLKPEADNSLALFPYVEAYDGEDQYIRDEFANDDGNIIIGINLGYRNDTTAAQEQFLNTNDQVISYDVSADVEAG